MAETTTNPTSAWMEQIARNLTAVSWSEFHFSDPSILTRPDSRAKSHLASRSPETVPN